MTWTATDEQPVPYLPTLPDNAEQENTRLILQALCDVAPWLSLVDIATIGTALANRGMTIAPF